MLGPKNAEALTSRLQGNGESADIFTPEASETGLVGNDSGMQFLPKFLGIEWQNPMGGMVDLPGREGGFKVRLSGPSHSTMWARLSVDEKKQVTVTIDGIVPFLALPADKEVEFFVPVQTMLNGKYKLRVMDTGGETLFRGTFKASIPA
jgi:hypothetical protein